MELPRYNFFTLSNIRVVYGGRIYCPTGQDSDSENHIFFPSLFKSDEQPPEIIFPLEAEETLVGLEARYILDNNPQIGAWQADFTKRFKIESASDLELKNRVKEAELLEFIVKKVFPYFISGTTKMDFAGLGVETPASKAAQMGGESYNMGGRSIADLASSNNSGSTSAGPGAGALPGSRTLIGSVFSMIGKEQVPQKKQTSPSELTIDYSVLERDVLKGTDICVIDQFVYSLIPRGNSSARRNDTVRVEMYGKDFTLMPQVGLSELERSFNKAMQDDLREKAIRNSPVILRNLEMRQRLLDEIAQPKYKDVGLSVKRDASDGSKYLICLDVPEHVLENRHGEFFYFPPTQVGLHVSIEDGSIVHSNTPIVVGEYKHPFTGDWAVNKDICTDGYSSPKSYSPEQKICDYLNVARNVLTSGYFESGSGRDVVPRIRLEWPAYKEPVFHKVAGMTREQIERKGLRITNRRFVG